jgi:GNAT superfamily N-acetyltransferase
METQPLPLDRIGQRFSIRLHDPEGGYRDVVGQLNSANTVIDRHGNEKNFDPKLIAYWREVISRPSAAGKGAPLTLRVLELDRICNATWPAIESEEFGGWLLRAANGVTNRANSVLPLKGALEAGCLNNFEENLAAAQNFYRSRNLPVIFHLAIPTWDELQSKLIELGSTELIRANTMVADLQSFEVNIPTELTLEVTDTPSSAWLNTPAVPGVEKILNGCPARYLGIRSGAEVIATARIALSEGWSSLTRVFVSEQFRGQGLGKAIVASAINESLLQGATKSVLQVEAKNEVAIDIYESLGFNFHHEYTYLELT